MQQAQFHEPSLVSSAFKGSTLEDRFKQDITHTPLWSAKPVEESPESIVDAHLGFLRAGAELILTCTYVFKRNTQWGVPINLVPGIGINVREKRSNKPGTLPRRVCG